MPGWQTTSSSRYAPTAGPVQTSCRRVPRTKPNRIRGLAVGPPGLEPGSGRKKSSRKTRSWALGLAGQRVQTGPFSLESRDQAQALLDTIRILGQEIGKRLRVRNVTGKTAWNVVAGFRAFLGWLVKVEQLSGVPKIAWPKKPRSNSATIGRATQRAILDAIPEEKRGVFLAMALLCIRPGESPKERD